jgi:predicted outer membrane repeat protein
VKAATAIACFALVFAASASLATTVHVDWDGGEYQTIQAGINAASVGDTVLVAAGEYMGPGNIDLTFSGKEIVLHSEEGPDATIINCQNSSRAFRFTAGETPEAVVGGTSQGFTIRNGAAPTSGETAGLGGAIYCATSAPVILGCRFENCEAVNGGALYLGISAVPQVVSCEFVGNEARDYGGAVYCYGADADLIKSLFEGNEAGISGGAVSCKTGTLINIQDCDFVENHSADGGAVYIGTLDNGGTEPEEPSKIYFSDFTRNTATRGGALFINGFTWANCSGCVFDYNSATALGGAVYALTDYTRALKLELCTFVFNGAGEHGGSVYSAGSFGFDMTIAQCIFAFGTGGGVVQAEDYGTIAPQYCVSYGNAGGDEIEGFRNISDEDPLFCGMLERNYYLCSNSVCLADNHPYNKNVGRYTSTYSTCAPCQSSPVEPTSWGSIKAMYR